MLVVVYILNFEQFKVKSNYASKPLVSVGSTSWG